MVAVTVTYPDVYPRPPYGKLPLSKGGDLVVVFRRMLDGVETNYSVGMTVALVIEILASYVPGVGNVSGSTITAAGTINGSLATCKIESTVADTVPAKSLWRCIVSYPTVPTTEVIAYNGLVDRADY